MPNPSKRDSSPLRDQWKHISDDLRDYIKGLEVDLHKTKQRMRWLLIVSSLLTLGLAGCFSYVVYDLFLRSEQPVTVPPATFPVSQLPVEEFASADDFVVYYGEDRVGELAQYDIAIIQPETLSPADLRLLNNSDTVTLAYLSVGEVESFREWYVDGRFRRSWILGTNENWGSEYVDVSEAGWQELIRDITGQYISRGFRGVFLDTVDVIDLFPNKNDDMIHLITSLRNQYPDMVIVQNRGFAILNQTAPLINGVMFESMTTSYSFADETYVKVEASVNENIIENLKQIQAQYNLQILVLDYAPADDSQMIHLARVTATEHGFLSSVSEITLQSIYSPN